jgi:serine/threonine protein kinase
MSVPEPGRLLAGRYRLGAIIGRGGMGMVWRARDELLARDVAVKEIILPPEMEDAEQEAGRRRAVREAQMAARLRHPNVVGIYDIVEDDGRLAIVMELVPFGSLRDTIRDHGPLPPTQAARIGLGVLAGLRAAHEAGVVHRDVKPANILLGPEDRVVLTDFGIAKAVDSPTLTTSGILIGSPAYLAPERARGQPAGAPAGLWGLGASLYTAVEGRPPFERPGALATLTAVVTDEPGGDASGHDELSRPEERQRSSRSRTVTSGIL